MTLGCFSGGHVFLGVYFESEAIKKPYSPISAVNEKGKATFVIKTYRKDPNFPNQGKMTQYLENEVKESDKLFVSGPIGMYQYSGNGIFAQRGKETKILSPKQNVWMIAGGSGVTPL